MSSSSSSLKSEIAAAFSAIGHPPLEPTVLARVANLSSSLRLAPTRLAEAWDAYGITKDLDALDEGTFAGYSASVAKDAGVGKPGKPSNAVVVGTTGLGKRKPPPGVTPSPAPKRPANATPKNDGSNAAARDGLSAVDGLKTPSGAASPTSKASRGSASSTVITPPKSSVKSYTAAAKPVVAPVARVEYGERTNAGQLVSSYNPSNLPTAAELLSSLPAEERARATTHRACVVSPHPRGKHPSRGYRHMFAPLPARSSALEKRLVRMTERFQERYGMRTEDEEMAMAADGPEEKAEGADGTEGAAKTEKREKAEGEEEKFDGALEPVGIPKQNQILCVGRICNEAHTGRLNRASVLLEGSRQHSLGARVKLDLRQLDETTGASGRGHSLFPGQIVAVEGTNPSGRTLRASRLLEGVPPPADVVPAKEAREYQFGEDFQGGRPLSIACFCGPYTARDNLDYDPLLDAVTKVAQDKPDVAILCGPFVDGRHPLIAGGEPTEKDEDDVVERKVGCERLFANKLSQLLEEFYQEDPDARTQFVLVPSLDDAFVEAVYPQPPFEDKAPGVKVPRSLRGAFGDLGLSYVELAGREDREGGDRNRPRRVHCVSNPCTLRINDVTLGVTSSDVLYHLSSDEAGAGLPPGTRLARLASHLVEQGSYYPLFPGAPGASLDLTRCEGWEMPVRPDVLVVPSRLASFARAAGRDGATVAVNPGELTKGTAGGTYAVVDVHPAKEEGGKEGTAGRGVAERVRVDIKRI